MRAQFIIFSLVLIFTGCLAQEDSRFIRNWPNIGVTTSYTWIAQDFDATSLDINGITPLAPIPAALIPDPALFNPGLITAVENAYSTYSMRFDSWLYPFLNVYGAIGKVDGEGTVTVGVPFNTDVTLGFEGFIYGGGVNLLIGSERLFMVNNVAYSITKMEAGDTVTTFNWRPKVGTKLSDDLAIWVGSTYQDTNRTQTGVVTLPGLPLALDYSLGTTNSNNWNIEFGGRYQINNDWSLTLEGGFSGRQKAAVSLRREF